MAKRDSNISIDYTDDEPAVHRRDAEASTDSEPTNDESTDETTTGVENPDGSTTVSATSKTPSGTSTATNVPGNSLDTEIRDFKNEVEHPEDWTDSELTAVAVHRRQSDFSHTEISDRVGISRSVVKRGRQKLVHTNLADEADIHEAFQECTTTQQTVIAASLAPTAYTTTEITEMADCATNTVHSTRQLSKPLMRKLDAVGLPDRLIPAAIRNDSTESDENNDTDETATDDEEPATETTTSDTSPTNETTPEPTTSRQAIEDIRRFVTGLRERATDSARSESPPARQRTAREATCEAILAYIETVDKQIEREPSR